MLKANGYTGKATVYYVEAPESLCGAADRYAGVYVVLEGTWPSTFARFAGIDELKVRSDARLDPTSLFIYDGVATGRYR